MSDLSKKVIDFLKKKPEQKFTAREIAKWIVEIYPEEFREKMERSEKINNKDKLVSQITSEIGARCPKLRNHVNVTEERPRKFYFTKSTDSTETDSIEIDSTEADNVESSSTSANLKEQDLYPKLSDFLREHNVYSRRINEGRSSNRGGTGANEWLHPDLVGMEDLSKDWEDEIKKCVETHDKKTKLWSFEVKLEITIRNVRKVFFQAVSNSSWANFGYLVTGAIKRGGKESPMKELGMLANRHGIGLIRLDVNDPEQSEIVIPAQERSEIDWDMANRLAKENSDFLKYIDNIWDFYKTGKISKYDWKYRD